MIYAVIDAAELRGRDDLHDRLAQALSLPGWYGRNLDALYDCLTGPGEPVTLRVDHPSALETVLGGYGRSLLHVLSDAQQEQGRFTLELGEAGSRSR